MNTNFHNILKSFFNNIEVVNFINNTNNIKTINFPRLNYFGINFKGDNIDSLKLYNTFFDLKSIGVIKKNLPKTDYLDHYLNYFKESSKIDLQNTGCAFSIKQNAKSEIKKGFHLRFPYSQQITEFEFPKFITLSEKDLLNYQGICFEYDSDYNYTKKNYYYISDINTKSQIAKMFNNSEIINSEIIEYTETQNESKIIIWSNEVNHLLKKIELDFSNHHKNFNGFMSEKLNLKNIFPGMYLNSEKHASYYFHNESNIEKELFDFKNKNIIDTIGYMTNYFKNNE